MNRRQVLLSGYFGFQNAGDEAILEAAVTLLRERRAELPICALSQTPALTADRLAISAVPRMSLTAVPAAMAASGLFVSGGGSLLQDVTSGRSLAYYLTLLTTARALGCKTMVMAQGIGPLSAASRRRVAGVLNGVDVITVRDAESAELLREIGVREEVEVTADLAFALAPRVTQQVTAACPPGSPRALAVSLRPWPGIEALLDPLAEALRQVRAEHPETPILGWPLSIAEDAPVLEKLATRVPGMQVLRGQLTPGEWVALAERAGLVLGARLHSLIFGACGSAPVLGISYDPKVDSLLDRVRGTRVAQISASGELTLDAALLQREIRRALAETPARRQMRSDRLSHLQALAGRNADLALTLLDQRIK